MRIAIEDSVDPFEAPSSTNRARAQHLPADDNPPICTVQRLARSSSFVPLQRGDGRPDLAQKMEVFCIDTKRLWGRLRGLPDRREIRALGTSSEAFSNDRSDSIPSRDTAARFTAVHGAAGRREKSSSLPDAAIARDCQSPHYRHERGGAST
jgi:hypothetical protein